MTNHTTYQLALFRISELHKEAAAARLAKEVPHGHRAGARRLLARWLRARRGRSRGPQPQAASDTR